MATEVEELRLVITLTDNASGGVAALRQQWAQLSGGATQGHVERFKRSHNELAKLIKEMTELAVGGEKAMLAFVGKLGIAGAAFAGITTVVVEGIKGLKEFSDKVTDLNNKARVFGVHPAVLKSIEEQLERIGITTDQADAAVQRFNDQYAKMGRAGSAERQDLINKAGRFGDQMREAIDTVLAQRTQAARMNEAMAQAQNVFNNRMKDTNNNIVDATNFMNEFLAKWGISPEFALVKHLHETSEEEKRTFENRIKATAEYRKSVVVLKQEWDDFMDDVKTSALGPDGTIVKGLHMAVDLTKFIHEMWDKPLTKQVAGGAAQALGSMIPGVNTIRFWTWIYGLYNQSQTKTEGQKGMGDALGLGNLPETKGGKDGEYKAQPLLSAIGETSENHMDMVKENTGELKKLNDYFTAERLKEEGGVAAGAVAERGGGGSPVAGGYTGGGFSGVPGGGTAPGGGGGGGGGGGAPGPGGGMAPGGGGGGGAAPYAGGAAQREAEAKFGMGAPGFPQGIPMKGVLGKGATDALTAATPGRGVLGTTSGTADQGQLGGSAFLENQRKPIVDEINTDPETRQLMHNMMRTEGGGVHTVEAAMNRVAMIKQRVPGYTLKDELKSGFYGPLNKGAGRQAIGDAEAGRYNKMIEQAGAGSDTIKGRTNQGMPSDPGARLPGRVPIEGSSEVYNYWEGRRKGQEFSTADSAAFAAAQERAVADRSMVDKKSVKTVKVDATGKVAVNIGGQNDATLGSQGLFKSTGGERMTQMQPAEAGPATFKERFEAATSD